MKKIAFLTAWLIISSGWIFVSGAWKVQPSYYDVTFYNEWNKAEVHVKVPTQKELDELKVLSKFIHLEYYNGEIKYSTQPDPRFKVSYYTDKYINRNDLSMAVGYSVAICVAVFLIILYLYVSVKNLFKG